jgi:hypothetical protein
MNIRTLTSVGTLLCLGLAAVGMQAAGYERHSEDAKLIAALPKSKHTLEEGIRQVASKPPEAAISAKFELDDKGQLSLSVYVAEKGLAVDAEHNVLKELAGSPESAAWTPEPEIFKDVEHVARSAEQLTIVAISKIVLTDVIKRAQKDQPGTVYSIAPAMRARRPVFVVLVADKGNTVELAYDPMTGDPVRGPKK